MEDDFEVINSTNCRDFHIDEDITQILIYDLPENFTLILENYENVESIVFKRLYHNTKDLLKNCKIILRNLKKLEIITALQVVDYFTIILDDNLKNLTKIKTIGNVKIIDKYNYLKYIECYDITIYNHNLYFNENYKYITDLTYKADLDPPTNLLDISNMNRLQSFNINDNLNVNIILQDLPELRKLNFKFQNHNESTITLGRNLNLLNKLQTSNTDIIIDDYNYLNNLETYNVNILTDNFIMNDRYSNATTLEIYSNNIEINLNECSKLINLHIFRNMNFICNTCFPSLTSLVINGIGYLYQEEFFDHYINLTGSKFPKIHNFEIYDQNLKTFISDYKFSSSLKELEFEIPRIKYFQIDFNSFDLPQLNSFSFNKFFRDINSIKLPYIFHKIIPNHLKYLYNGKIELPPKKSAYNNF